MGLFLDWWIHPQNAVSHGDFSTDGTRIEIVPRGKRTGLVSTRRCWSMMKFFCIRR